MRQISVSGKQREIAPAAEKRAPGRPRSEHAKDAILRSTFELLKKVGYQDLSIEAVASRANVGKATVYRWWPNKAALAADAFISGAEEQLRFPYTGSVLSDLTVQMSHLVQVFTRRGKLISSLIGGGQTDAELSEAYRERFMLPRRREAYKRLQRAVEEKELPDGLDFDLLLDSLYGPIYMRFLIGHDTLTQEFVTDLCNLILKPILKRSKSNGRH